MSDPEKKIKLREQYRSALLHIWRTISALDTDLIEASQATDAGIQQRPMSLKQKPEQPIFFIPYDGELESTDDGSQYPTLITDPDDELYHNLRTILYAFTYQTSSPTLHALLNNPPGIWRRDNGCFNFGDLCELTGRQWAVFRLYTTPRDIRLPHMKCTMYNEIEGNDDQLTRGEISSIIHIMVGRLHTKHLRPHVIAPVMVFSVLLPYHIRVLEAYYNGEKLIIRKTKLYDVKENMGETLELLNQWLLGYATGETTTMSVS